MQTKKISLFSLIMLIVASIDSIRNLPSAALFGSALVFFFIVSSIVFLVPTALVSAELTASYPDKGGVYYWVYRALGEKAALLAIWMQWINTMVWYPTILSFIAATASYLIDPALAQNKTYLITLILGVFWFMTLVNFKGLHFSAKINSFCGMIGTVIPMTFLIGLGAIWFFSGKPLHISLNANQLIPSLADSTNWISLIAIMASFLGMELTAVHVNDINEPQKKYPQAVLLSSLFILITMLFGSLAIAFVLPAEKINLIAGVMQVLSYFFEEFHMGFLTPVLSICIVLGLMGSIINWLISPAKGLLHAAEFGYLPPFFTKRNKNGSPVSILLAQGVVVSLLCIVFLLVPSINGFYWFLTALSTGLYMIMYVLMFLSFFKLRRAKDAEGKNFRVPGGMVGVYLLSFLGCFGCLITIIVSFIPPDNIEVGSSLRYVLMVLAANLLAILPVSLLIFYKSRRGLIRQELS